MIKGSPFIVSDDLQKGTLFYDGNFYRNVNLNFDVANDLVVIKDYSKSFPLALVRSKISFFTIRDRYFVNPSAIQGPVSSLPNEIVERVFDADSVKVYVKRLKKLFRPLNANTEDNMSVYRDYDRYFIFRQNKYSSFTNLKEMISLLGEVEQKMRKFARLKKIKLEKLSDEDIRTLLTYYTQ